jgi:hypothetical protein
MILFRKLKLSEVMFPPGSHRFGRSSSKDQVGRLLRERERWAGYEYFLIGDEIVVVPPSMEIVPVLDA